ncbi:MAG: glycosyltransferase family 4 protein, partial [Halioglobus sp.]|nr:glycosyltransferase family 4 protein [Halioglobus sp.]
CPLSTLWQMREAPCVNKRCVRCTIDAGRPPQWWRYTGNLERNLRHVDALLAPSEFAIAKHVEMGLTVPFTLLPNFLPGADPVEDAGAKVATTPRERPFFLFAGRLDQTKGVQVLVDAFRRFDAADLLIVGAGPHEETLREQATGLDHVHFTGQMPYAQLQGLYRDAVATLVPSMWYEPFGLIVLESFAQGTPVIVNNAGAPPELVKASGGGLVYDSPTGLLEALQKLCGDHTLATDLGEHGRAALDAHWTEERHLEQYLALVNQHLERRGAA